MHKIKQYVDNLFIKINHTKEAWRAKNTPNSKKDEESHMDESLFDKSHKLMKKRLDCKNDNDYNNDNNNVIDADADAEAEADANATNDNDDKETKPGMLNNCLISQTVILRFFLERYNE